MNTQILEPSDELIAAALGDIADKTVVDSGRATDMLLDIMNATEGGTARHNAVLTALSGLGERSMVTGDELRDILGTLD